MIKFHQTIVLIAILSNGCFGQSDDLTSLQAKGPYAELLRDVYQKSVEWHTLLQNKFFAVHSNLSREVLDVNSKSVTSLIKGVEKLETIRTQVKSFLNSHRNDNFDCVTKVEKKLDKVLFKIGNKISDCVVMAIQQVEAITNRKIDLGSDILEVAELSLSETLEAVSDHFTSGISFDELKDIREEYQEAFDEVDKEIYDEVLPSIDEEMNDIIVQALTVPPAIDMCMSNVLMKLNTVVSEVGKSVEKCSF